MTALYCRARVNSHITVIRCVFNCCFHTVVSFCCVYFVIERKVHSIYLHINPNAAQQLQVRPTAFALKRCVYLFLLNCIQEGWTTVLRYIATLVKLQYCRLSTTKIFVDNFLLSTLSTNRCSPRCSVIAYVHDRVVTRASRVGFVTVLLPICPYCMRFT